MDARAHPARRGDRPTQRWRDSAPAQQKPPAANQSAAATKAFLDRLQDYVRYHNNVEKMVPPLTDTSDPAKISDREKALGDALIKQRPDAKPGDFLITQYQPILAQIIKDDFAHRPLADRKALIRELPKGLTVDVNTIYPTTIAAGDVSAQSAAKAAGAAAANWNIESWDAISFCVTSPAMSSST